MKTRTWISKVDRSVEYLVVFFAAFFLLASCDSPTGSGDSDNDNIVLGSGQVVLANLAPASLPVGQNAIFTLSLDLPALSDPDHGYRVWVYPESGTYESYRYRNSEVVGAVEANLSRYAYVGVGGADDFERSSGSVDTWVVSISQWDGNENTSFARYSFEHTVVWE